LTAEADARVVVVPSEPEHGRSAIVAPSPVAASRAVWLVLATEGPATEIDVEALGTGGRCTCARCVRLGYRLDGPQR